MDENRDMQVEQSYEKGTKQIKREVEK